MTEFVIYTMRVNGKESGYRRKFLQKYVKKQPHFDLVTKVRLIFTLFYLPMISAKSTLRFS